MNKILTIAALALIGVVLLPGCTATKIEYEQNNKGETKYSLWHNDHWLKTNAERMEGGMDKEGKLSWQLAGLSTSPSEEFNRTMRTYMGAIVSAMQIVAAAYNPSASAALANMQGGAAAAAERPSGLSDLRSDIKTGAAIQDGGATNGVECVDGSCVNK